MASTSRDIIYSNRTYFYTCSGSAATKFGVMLHLHLYGVSSEMKFTRSLALLLHVLTSTTYMYYQSEPHTNCESESSTEHNATDQTMSSKCMRGSRKFCQRGPTFFSEGREDSNTTISGRSLARQRKAINVAFHWLADDGLTLNVGLVAL